MVGLSFGCRIFPESAIHLQLLNVCPGCDRHTLLVCLKCYPELNTAYPGRGLIWINLFPAIHLHLVKG